MLIVLDFSLWHFCRVSLRFLGFHWGARTRTMRLKEDLLSYLARALNRRDAFSGDVPSQAALFTRDILVDQNLTLCL